jgi:hypothetical protein
LNVVIATDTVNVSAVMVRLAFQAEPATLAVLGETEARDKSFAQGSGMAPDGDDRRSRGLFHLDEPTATSPSSPKLCAVWFQNIHYNQIITSCHLIPAWAFSGAARGMPVAEMRTES